MPVARSILSSLGSSALSFTRLFCQEYVPEDGWLSITLQLRLVIRLRLAACSRNVGRGKLQGAVLIKLGNWKIRQSQQMDLLSYERYEGLAECDVLEMNILKGNGGLLITIES